MTPYHKLYTISLHAQLHATLGPKSILSRILTRASWLHHIIPSLLQPHEALELLSDMTSLGG